MAKPTLLGFDAFSKTLDDQKIKTSAGGIISIICFFSTFLLLWFEWGDYNTIVLRPELVVDRASNELLKINIDISFFEMPCDLFTLDVMDLTGDVQLDLLSSGFVKYRLDGNGNQIEHSETELGANILPFILGAKDDGYCGSCYGSINQDGNDGKPNNEKICCNDCSAVRYAYTQSAWKFVDGAGIEQCEREGYVQRINERLHEGCRVKGVAQINRIGGNIHFAPGASVTHRDRHIHDLSLFEKHADLFSMKHKINHFSFGDDTHELQHIFENDSHNHHTSHPLDDTEKNPSTKWLTYSYFSKVVNTRFEYLDGTKIETNEFSVTQHDKPMRGGRDENNPNVIHGNGGLPGIFFHFDVSPLKIINREAYKKSFGGFILSFCSAVAGLLSVGAILDRLAYSAKRFLKDKKKI